MHNIEYPSNQLKNEEHLKLYKIYQDKMIFICQLN